MIVDWLSESGSNDDLLVCIQSDARPLGAVDLSPHGI